eukprot:gnl/Chilomastix_cuspidata/3077.p1 GENE.gnl/Chilomastix_cuspidata/3077~~gnl/Chilomastix_cuspidata/3077.p1  ORF type:complete len:875 (-),score=384.48 gnl/Chilomastix_cuspidata/3077:277-2901(-)
MATTTPASTSTGLLHPKQLYSFVLQEEVPAPPTIWDIWSYEEDELLFKVMSSDHASKGELTRSYLQAQKSNPLLFNIPAETLKTSNILLERLDDLRTNPAHALRRRLLAKNMQIDPQGPAAEEEENSLPSPEIVDRSKQLTIFVYDSPAEVSEYNPSNPPRRPVVTNIDPVIAQSRYIHARVAGTRPPVTVNLSPDAMCVICDAHGDSYHHVDSTTLSHFLMFCRHPTLQDDIRLLEKQKVEVEESVNSAHSEIVAALNRSREAKLRELQQWHTNSSGMLLDRSQRALEMEVLQIHRRHEQVLRLGLDQLKQQFKEREEEIHNYFNNELKTSRAKLHRVSAAEQMTINHEIAKQKRIVEAMFTPTEVLPRLITTGIFLDSPAFLNLCMQYFAEHITDPGLVFHPLLNECKLFTTDHVREALSSVKLDDLFKLRTHFHLPPRRAAAEKRRAGPSQPPQSARGATDVRQSDPKQVHSARKAGPLSPHVADFVQTGLAAVAEEGDDIQTLQPAISPIPSRPGSRGGAAGARGRKRANSIAVAELPPPTRPAHPSASHAPSLVVPVNEVRREIQIRRVSIAEKYSGWSLNRLNRELLRKNVPFREILEELITQRKRRLEQVDLGAGGEDFDQDETILFTASRDKPYVAISGGGLIAEPVAHSRYVPVFSTLISYSSNWAKVFFEMDVRSLSTKTAAGTSLCVGFFDRDAIPTDPAPTMEAPMSYGILVQNTGHIYHRDLCSFGDFEFVRNDTISVFLEPAARCIHFFRNGEPLVFGPLAEVETNTLEGKLSTPEPGDHVVVAVGVGPVKEDEWTEHLHTDVQLYDTLGPFKLTPGVLFYQLKSAPSTKVRLRFKPRFKYQPEVAFPKATADASESDAG